MIPKTLDQIDEELSSQKFTHSIDFTSLTEAEITDDLLGESSLNQWIITKNHLKNPTLETTQQSNLLSIEQLAAAATNLPAITAILSSSTNIVGADKRTRQAFREKYFSNQESWPNLIISNTASLLCSDDYSKGLPSQLYKKQQEQKLVTAEDFRGVIKELLHSTTIYSSFENQEPEKIDEIGTIIYELFKNTEDHAKTSEKGRIISDSTRGIFSKFYENSELRLKLNNKKILNPAERYAATLQSTKKNSYGMQIQEPPLLGFIEISVFDSGPGLAARWLGRTLDQSDTKVELEAIAKCFEKGNSSSLSISRGFGLWKVLQSIKGLRGFIRIRTNHAHIFRQYSSWPDLDSPNKDEKAEQLLYDWKREFTWRLSNYPAVSGTLISILLPVEDAQ